ncbi:MAG: hypothetical protein GY787_19715, partial [Alteromonadales bacterium]|nr:hypothetical protein [Alteromonadales bacterium]
MSPIGTVPDWYRLVPLNCRRIYDKRFKFTNATLRAIPANSVSAKSADLEVSDTEHAGLKLLS